jgi:thiol-disulfide isomerase/thioredoxin
MTEPAPRRPDRTWLYVGLAFALFWAVYLARFGPVRTASGPALEGSGLSEPADYNWTLADLDGNPVEFSRYKGKAVFLNVWATWCPPCVREMPSIAALAANEKLKDVAFVCVSTDDSPETVKRFLQGKGWPMTVLRTTPRMPRVFTTDGIPATFLIAPDGRIAAAEVRSADWNEPKVVSFLEKLAAGTRAN